MNKGTRRFLRRAIWISLPIAIVLGLQGYAWMEVHRVRESYPLSKYRSDSKTREIQWVQYRPKSWISLPQISTQAKMAVLISEDWAFYSHGGVDYRELKKAIQDNLAQKRYGRGASTISQQVSKNLFLSPKKSLWRKFRELQITFALERQISKSRILEMYFNIVEWGEGVYGIRQASAHYFSKHPVDLNSKEGAFLAMLLPNPKRYSASFQKKRLTPYAEITMKRLMNKMVQAKVMTEQERDYAWSAPLSFEVTVPPPIDWDIENGYVLDEE